MGRGGRSGGARFAAALLASALAAGPATAAAIVTFDLLHDTESTRELLRDELGAAGPAAAVAGAGAGQTPAGRGEFEAIWFARERYLQIGEAEKAEQQLSLLWERAVARGIRNLPEYGTVLVREAERRMRAGDLEQAARALGHARRLAPDELAVYTTGARLALKRSALNVAPVLEELTGGLRAIRRSFRLQAWLGANAAGGLMGGLLFFLCLSTAALFARSAPRIAHDLRESVGFGSPRARTVLSWVLLASPALLGLSPWWWAVVAGLLAWPYLAGAERGLAAVGALFLLALPALVRESAVFVAMPQNELLESVLRVREGHWDEPDYRELRSHAERGTAGLAGVTALGIAARRLGLLDEAEAAVRAGLAAVPADPALWNNLGTIAFTRRDLDAAFVGFGKAAELDPDLFAARYNLGVAHRDRFNLADGDAEMRRAGEIDPAAVSLYAGLPAEALASHTVDAPPSLATVWALAHQGGETQDAAAELLWDGAMLGPSLESWPLVVAALLLLGAAAGALRLRRGTATACERCGRVFCPRCQGGKRGFLCSQCHHIFVKKAGVDASVRVQKMGDIKSHKWRLRIRHLVFAALAPGGGHLSAGRFWAGVALLLPASFLESRVLLGAGTRPSPWSLGGASTSPLHLAGIVVLALLWALSLFLAARLEE